MFRTRGVWKTVLTALLAAMIALTFVGCKKRVAKPGEQPPAKKEHPHGEHPT